ncbi:protein jagunal homolog 1 isoform X1 [Lampetra fluviatilis]
MASAATRTVASKNERARRETKADGEDKLRSSLESEVRMLVYVHVVLWALVLLQVIVSSLRLVPSSLVARPYLWEYPYLLSVAPALLTISAMRRRSTYRMVLAMAMTSLVSLGPLVYGSVEMFPMARQLYTQGKVYRHILGFSAVSVLYFAMVIAVQVHGWQLYYCKQLLEVWSSAPTQEAPGGQRKSQ